MENRKELDERKETLVSEEDDYNEDEDEDFDPTKERLENQHDDTDDEEEEKDGGSKSSTKLDYSRIESEQGGLIRTRHAKMLEDELARNQNYESLQNEGVSEETTSLWEELKLESGRRLLKKTSVMSEAIEPEKKDLLEELMLIDRKYKFAGELIHEKKWVPKSSAEAQEYLKSLKFEKKESSGRVAKHPTNENGVKLRKPLKRPPILEQIIAGALKPKLTTLEKSKMDWARYVDKEGINDELTLHNKDGYLAKQDFLNRVESFKDQEYREMRKKQLQQKSNT